MSTALLLRGLSSKRIVSKFIPQELFSRSRVFLSTSSVPITTISDLLKLKPSEPVSDVQVNGFVRSARSLKNREFFSIVDGSSVVPLQAVIPTDKAVGLTVGAAVRLRGSWVPSPAHGQSHELSVDEAIVLGPSDASTFPIQNKYQTPGYLRTLPHLRPRLPFNAALMRFRSELISSLTQFFNNCEFIQTHTPILTSSDCEGAGEVFQVSSAHAQSNSTSEEGKHFFRRPVYATVSAQLHLEALAQALGNVWTLSPTFRAERSDTQRHLSEFYMLEAEMSFTDDIETVMDLLEGMLRHVGASMAHSNVVQDLMIRTPDRELDLATAEEVKQRWSGLTQGPWPRITYTEAIGLLKSSEIPFTHEPKWGEDLHTEHEKYIATKVSENHSPVFVTHYPRQIKPFYMKADSHDPITPVPGQTVASFDLLVPEFCEIAGGSLREHRLDRLKHSMWLRGINSKAAPLGDDQQPFESENNLDWYVDLRRWGCPPHGGFGLGFDRLICYLSGVQTVHDSSAFPRWYGRCHC
ncbi:hypothetical protein F4810DRAFT_711005 [Camillea tinctor]|nr:hypothetical protein F4810DRAFT_711005 [Camillea tinctor]